MDMTTFTALALGSFASLGIELLKAASKKWQIPNLTGRDGLMILAMVAGGIYAAWFYLVPVGIQESFGGFILKTLGTAVLVYEFLLKNSK